MYIGYFDNNGPGHIMTLEPTPEAAKGKAAELFNECDDFSGFRILPCTDTLAFEVERHGGDIMWAIHDGTACALAEADNQA